MISVGGLSYSGDLTINDEELHYHVNLTWNDIMDPNGSWEDGVGAWMFLERITMFTFLGHMILHYINLTNDACVFITPIINNYCL